MGSITKVGSASSFVSTLVGEETRDLYDEWYSRYGGHIVSEAVDLSQEVQAEALKLPQ